MAIVYWIIFGVWYVAWPQLDEVWSWWRLKVECHHPPTSMVRFCDHSADIGRCSCNNATYLNMNDLEWVCRHTTTGFKHKLGSFLTWQSDTLNLTFPNFIWIKLKWSNDVIREPFFVLQFLNIFVVTPFHVNKNQWRNW